MSIFCLRFSCRRACILHFVLTTSFMLYLCQFLKYSPLFPLYGQSRLKVEETYKEENTNAASNDKHNIFRKPKEFFRQLEFLKMGSRSEMVFTVITAKRSLQAKTYDPRYLTQVVSKIVDLFSRHENYKYRSSLPVKLLVCNVNAEANDHSEALSISSHTGVHMIRKYGNSSSSTSDIFAKEGEDYIFCINETFKLTSANFAVIIEDDALPNNDMLEVLNHVAGGYFRNKTHGDTAFMSLHFPTKFQSYSIWRTHQIIELIYVSFILSAVIALLVSYLKCLRKTVCLCLFIYLFIHTLFILGVLIDRVYLLRLRSLSKYLYGVVPAQGCCTAAVMYTRGHYKTVLSHLARAKISWKFRKDIALNQLQEKTGLKGVLVEPSLFRHIGVYSSLKKRSFRKD